jgi:hypothetical protein
MYIVSGAHYTCFRFFERIKKMLYIRIIITTCMCAVSSPLRFSNQDDAVPVAMVTHNNNNNNNNNKATTTSLAEAKKKG